MATEDTWHRRPKDGEADPPTCNHRGKVPSARHGRGLRWRVRWRGHAESFRTQDEADQYWLRVRTTVAEAPSETTVGALVDLWLDTKQGLSYKGLEACRGAALHVHRMFGLRLAAGVKRDEVQAWLGGMAGSASLRAKAHQCLAGAMEIGVDRGLITVSPCRGVRPPKDQRREARFLTGPELGRLADEAVGYRPMVLLLGTTGLRIGECVALNVGDVDAARRRLRVRKSKTGKARDVPVPPPVLALLDLDRPADAPLFVSATGKRLSTGAWRARVFAPAVERAGLGRVTPHDLRHTAASLAIHAGADVKKVQQMLGHASAAMTLDLYGHLMDEGLDDVADRMGRLLGYRSGTVEDA